MKKAVIFLLIGVFSILNTKADKLLDSVLDSMNKRSAPKMLGVKWAPSSNYFAFLADKDKDGKTDLWVYNVKTGKETEIVNAGKFKIKETEEEKRLKERMRIGNYGIVFFYWFNTQDKILFNISGNFYIAEVATKKLTKVNISQKPVLFPEISKNDDKIAFVSRGNVYVYFVKQNRTVAITEDGNNVKYYGTAEFVASEELGRYKGLWFSPDGKELFFTCVDESKMQEYPIVVNTSFKPRYFLQKYPFAGGKNAKVKLFKAVFKEKGFDTKEVNFPLKEECYLARVYFVEHSPLILWINRKQNKLYKFILERDKVALLQNETAEDWINLDKNFYPLGEKRFLYCSENTPSGYRHLFVFDNGKIEQLTKGEWEIKSFKGFYGEKLYFTANITHPNNTDLACYNLKTKTVKVITEKKGYHSISMSSDCKYYLDTFSNRKTPFEKYLVKTESGEKILLDKIETKNIDNLPEMKIEEVSFKTKDGTTLYGVLYLPEKIGKGVKLPVLVYTYGGPHAQVCANFYNPRDMIWYRYLVGKGIAVFKMDNRGSSGRGHKFESPVYRNLGDLELKDQIAGVNHICSKYPFLDKTRVGIWGWSYGGYMTLMAMTKFAPFFKVGVAVAPVSDWHLYDTAYTERYMDLPENNKQGYETSSALNFTDKLTGKLLVIHGVSDDNVHFQNTELFINKLIENGKYVDLMVYPGKKHSIRGKQTRKHLFKLITEYILKNL